MEVNEHESHGKLKVTVFAPSVKKPREFTFQANQTVGDAATHVAKAFELHPTAPSFEAENEERVLDRTKTLVDAGVYDGELLELVDVGGGV